MKSLRKILRSIKKHYPKHCIENCFLKEISFKGIHSFHLIIVIINKNIIIQGKIVCYY